ncbi:MAG: DUF6909 family protein [Desulfobacterales bacterium]
MIEELTRSQKGRIAVRVFKTTAEALTLRGYYRLRGKSGSVLSRVLKDLSPEIYGCLASPRIVELEGLQYVLDRLPGGITICRRIILTAQEDLNGTTFQMIRPPKRRRISYRMSEEEICFVVTRGMSEIYDILTHLTFLHIEADKIQQQMKDAAGRPRQEWAALEAFAARKGTPSREELERALWNLSVVLGRTFKETQKAYETMEAGRGEHSDHGNLFQVVSDLGHLVENELNDLEKSVVVLFTPSLVEMIVKNTAGKSWADAVKSSLSALQFSDRPIHVISANMHSVVNTLYAYAAAKTGGFGRPDTGLAGFIGSIRDRTERIRAFGEENGLFEIPDQSGSQIDCQIIDTSRLVSLEFHPEVTIDRDYLKREKPVILVLDYAFGAQAFDAMDELLMPVRGNHKPVCLDIRSISIMGKAGILSGKKGDIMLATGHVSEGIPENYTIPNELKKEDFDASIPVHVGPIITVLGTSLQNRDILKRFHESSWNAVGLEMEGCHYQRAISAAIVRRHISSDVKLMYAYYASDNPLVSGQTLASGGLGEEGIAPTYQITRAILKKILHP